MPNMEVVDPSAREARRHVRAVLLLLQDEREEALDGGRGNVVPVRALNEGLALKVEDGYDGAHGSWACARLSEEREGGGDEGGGMGGPPAEASCAGGKDAAWGRRRAGLAETGRRRVMRKEEQEQVDGVGPTRAQASASLRKE